MIKRFLIEVEEVEGDRLCETDDGKNCFFVDGEFLCNSAKLGLECRESRFKHISTTPKPEVFESVQLNKNSSEAKLSDLSTGVTAEEKRAISACFTYEEVGK